MSRSPNAPDGLREDERALLEARVRELGPRLHAYIRRAFPAISDPDEILAETFVRAATHLATWADRERPELYFLTIVRNLCRDRHRRKQPDAQPADWLPLATGAGDDPGRSMEERDQIDRLQGEVQRLPEHLREVVALRFSAGLQFDEIAELLGIPLGTALSRGHAALGRLRAQMEKINEPRIIA